MRISTQLMYQQTINNVSDAQSDWLKMGEKMNTGKKIITPSDDPVAASQVIVVSQAESQNKQYALARSFATQRESLEDSILSQVTSVVTSAYETVVQAGNSTLNDNDRKSLAISLQGVRDQLMNIANGTDGNGRYIFAGYKTDKPPFAEREMSSVTTDTTVSPPVTTTTTVPVIGYQGGDTPIEQKVDADRTMVVGHIGEKIFGVSPDSIKDGEPYKDGEKIDSAQISVFKTLDDIIGQLNKPILTDEDRSALNTAVDAANKGLRTALNRVSDVHAQVGIQLKELGNLDDLGAQREVSLKIQRSNLEDVDWTQAISEYKLKMYTLNAAYQTFTDMKGLSLFQINH